MKIKIKYHNKEYKLQQHDNWVDLATQKDENLKSQETKIIPLGISMKIPKYYEAHILPRSSTYLKWGIVMVNSMGIIDSDYCGERDVWGFVSKADNTIKIPKNTRIAQFTLVPSFNAPIWVKIRHLFVKFKFVEVDVLTNKSRGGFGSTEN